VDHGLFGQEHGDLAVVKQVEQQCFRDVLLVVGQGDIEYVLAFGDLEEPVPAFPATEKAAVLEFTDLPVDGNAYHGAWDLDLRAKILYRGCIPTRELRVDMCGADLPFLTVTPVVELK
jgi:hypothetical protein